MPSKISQTTAPLAMDPSTYKDLKTSRGLTYYYFHSAPKDSKPTILCLHGYPSTSFEWRYVCKFLGERGYGLIIPDLLGFGRTDKPTTPDTYRMKYMVADIVEIVDKEKAETVVVLSHDWGSGLCSRLANYRADRFAAFAFFALGYFPPMPDFDIDAMNAQSLEKHGYENFGYWNFFAKDEAAKVIEEHSESFFSLILARDPTTWYKHVCPTGAIEAWLSTDQKTERATYISEEDFNTWKEDAMKGGFTGPLCWYKAFMQHLTPKDDAEIPKENYVIAKPVFFAACLKDAPCVASENIATVQAMCPNATIVNFDTDHWVLDAAPQMVNVEVLKWLESLKL